MPSYRIHIFLYFIFLPFLLKIFPYEGSVKLLVFSILLGAFYSFFPDIDASNSKVRKFVNIVLFITILFSMSVYLLEHSTYALGIGIVSFVFYLFLQNVRHRGFFHSFLSCLLFSCPLIFISYQTFILGFYGYFLHIIVDYIYSKTK